MFEENCSSYWGVLIIKLKYRVNLENRSINIWSKQQGGLYFEVIFK